MAGAHRSGAAGRLFGRPFGRAGYARSRTCGRAPPAGEAASMACEPAVESVLQPEQGWERGCPGKDAPDAAQLEQHRVDRRRTRVRAAMGRDRPHFTIDIGAGEAEAFLETGRLVR